jgi:serine/threonine protein kinase
MWSQGCVLAELLIGAPIFPGTSAVDQLVEVIKVLGSPTKEELMAMNPNYQEFKFPHIVPQPLNIVFKPTVPADAVDIVKKMLTYTPSQRCKAMEACLHPFFSDLRDPATKNPDGSPLPLTMFTFTSEEIDLSPELAERLIPDHLRGIVSLPMRSTGPPPTLELDA